MVDAESATKEPPNRRKLSQRQSKLLLEIHSPNFGPNLDCQRAPKLSWITKAKIYPKFHWQWSSGSRATSLIQKEWQSAEIRREKHWEAQLLTVQFSKLASAGVCVSQLDCFKAILTCIAILSLGARNHNHTNPLHSKIVACGLRFAVWHDPPVRFPCFKCAKDCICLAHEEPSLNF